MIDIWVVQIGLKLWFWCVTFGGISFIVQYLVGSVVWCMAFKWSMVERVM